MLRPDKNLALEEDIPRNPKPTKEENTSLRTKVKAPRGGGRQEDVVDRLNNVVRCSQAHSH